MANLTLRITDAPPQLIAHCTRPPAIEARPTQSDYDSADVARLVTFLTEEGEFVDYDSWYKCGMAIRLALGDEGFPIWQLTFNDTVTEQVAVSKWNSFDQTASASSVTLGTWLQRAHALGWTGSIRRSTASMFAGVAQMASPSIVPAAATDPLATFSAASLAGQTVPTRRWHVRDMIPADTVTLLNGDGGTGKSLLALQLAVSTVAGKLWIGRVPTNGSCLFLTAEDARDEVHRRLDDIARESGIKLSDLTDLHISSLAGADAILAAPDGRTNIIAATVLFDALDARIAALRPALVVLDTLADLFGGEENQRAQARQFIGLLRGLCLRHATTVLLLAHPSLSGMANGSGSSGSTGWNNSVRSRLYFNRIRGEGGVEPDPDARVLRSMKSNYGRVGEETVVHWRRGMFVPEQVSAGSLVAAHDARNRADEVFVKMLMLFDAQGLGSVSPNPGSNYAPKVFADHIEAQGLKARVLKAAMDRLLTANRIQTRQYGPPSRIRQQLVVTSKCDYPATNLPTNAPTNAIPPLTNGVPTPLPTPPKTLPTPLPTPCYPNPHTPMSLRAPDGAPRA